MGSLYLLVVNLIINFNLFCSTKSASKFVSSCLTECDSYNGVKISISEELFIIANYDFFTKLENTGLTQFKKKFIFKTENYFFLLA